MTTVTTSDTSAFETLAGRLRRHDGGLALIPYLMAGHPDLATTREVGRRLVHEDVAAIEIGVPYSDPLADGPVIQRAGRRALDGGVTMSGCLEVAADIAAERATPVVLMTYVNPILAYGPVKFARSAAQAGVAGIVVPDLPVEESAWLAEALGEHGLGATFLVAPTSSDERIAEACEASTGFVYCVTVTGITGSRVNLPTGVPDLLARVRKHTTLPVAAGFGISRPEHLGGLRGARRRGDRRQRRRRGARPWAGPDPTGEGAVDSMQMTDLRSSQGVVDPPTTRRWHPGSWRGLPISQQPDWPDPDGVRAAVDEIALLPPLVLPNEIQNLRHSLADVAAGKAFLLQAGDCAERFSSCTERAVRGKLRVILQLAILLTYGSGLPVVKVGRIAGQFAKPRSKPTERVDGMELPVFRGDIVNGPEPTPEARRPDATRLTRAYHHASATLNVLRALTREGYADLNQVHAWNQEFVRRSPAGQHYEAVAGDIAWALRFMSACGADMSGLQALREAHVFTSHEALLLPFEQALTRFDHSTGSWFDTSAHMLWLGDRTRDPRGAHLEFLSGVANPIGVKVGPSTTPAELREVCERIDPDAVPGRLVLISRLGAQRVGDLLPPLLRAVRSTGRSVVWACDPMHGNTFVSDSGYKTRRLTDITSEVSGFFAAHKDEGMHPGGVHLELTGDDVTECLGGADEVLDSHLYTRYETACDPRLNASQSIELAFQVAERLREASSPMIPPFRRAVPENSGKDER